MPIRAPEQTCAKCHTRVPAPICAPVSTIALGWIETLISAHHRQRHAVRLSPRGHPPDLRPAAGGFALPIASAARRNKFRRTSSAAACASALSLRTRSRSGALRRSRYSCTAWQPRRQVLARSQSLGVTLAAMGGEVRVVHRGRLEHRGEPVAQAPVVGRRLRLGRQVSLGAGLPTPPARRRLGIPRHRRRLPQRHRVPRMHPLQTARRGVQLSGQGRPFVTPRQESATFSGQRTTSLTAGDIHCHVRAQSEGSLGDGAFWPT